MPVTSEKAIKLILDFEGLNQPGNWPGGQSGITIGIGYDLGYVSVDRFESDWGAYLSSSVLKRLRAVIGLIAQKAKQAAPGLKDIKVKRSDSETVFIARTLPLTVQQTRIAFPGFDRLPIDAQGALVSLVYNRGTSMVDPPGDTQQRRREMRAIRQIVATTGDLQTIADQLRSMKRLWVGQGLDGLIRRREAEARLVESAIQVIPDALTDTDASPESDPEASPTLQKRSKRRTRDPDLGR